MGGIFFYLFGRAFYRTSMYGLFQYIDLKLEKKVSHRSN